MDIPIIYSTPMILALDREVRDPGTGKTMTRRLAWRDAMFGLQDYASEQLEDMDAKGWNVVGEGNEGLWRVYKPTAWQNVKPGDRLWVRENFWRYGRWVPKVRADGKVENFFEALPLFGRENLSYAAGKSPLDFEPRGKLASMIPGWHLRPNIFLPRGYSRFTLIVTATKIERLKDITEADAIAEGVEHRGYRDFHVGDGIEGTDAIACFAALWWSLHGIGAWDANPEVVCPTFRVIRANVDAPEAAA